MPNYDLLKTYKMKSPTMCGKFTNLLYMLLTPTFRLRTFAQFFHAFYF